MNSPIAEARNRQLQSRITALETEIAAMINLAQLNDKILIAQKTQLAAADRMAALIADGEMPDLALIAYLTLRKEEIK